MVVRVGTPELGYLEFDDDLSVQVDSLIEERRRIEMEGAWIPEAIEQKDYRRLFDYYYAKDDRENCRKYYRLIDEPEDEKMWLWYQDDFFDDEDERQWSEFVDYITS